MKNLSLLSLLLVLFPFSIVPAQENKPPQSLSETFINRPSDKKLSLGMYGHIDYTQPLDDSLRKNGKLDVTRLVMLMNYKFSDNLDFFSEVEFEHVKELWVEQAFLQYRFNDALMLRGGLMVIPMGIVNEYHEPTTYNGVKRPSIDTRIVPTTWREIGFGLSGNLSQAYLKYQIYLVNGFKSYDGTANLGGPNGFRSGRQRGAESFISSPNLSAKVDFYGISGLNIGLAGYFGNTQSTLYQDLQKDDKALNDRADSSVVNLAMMGVDARYTLGGLQLRGQYIINMIGNTAAYNNFTGKDLGSRMGGWYAEAAWNLLHGSEAAGRPLTLFARIEQYDLHAATENGLARNKAYNMTEITTGLGYSIAEGAVIKADVQLISDKSESAFHPTINAGIGFNF
ncbi:MAG: hypothetical protein FD166_1401 [Bacteroidetes bacterium]|nr:MAG: hypothetical protein FD166_1401 [Bacteroidota bacterium]